MAEDDWGLNMTDEEEAMMQIRAMEDMDGNSAARGNNSAKLASSGTGSGAESNSMATAASETMPPPPPIPDVKPKTSGWANGWIPPHVEPVLEEQPKWSLLADVLDEIENDLHWSPADTCQWPDTILS